MTVIDLTKLIRKYKSGWISVSEDNKKVIAHSGTLKNLIVKISKLGNPNGYIMRAGSDFSKYVG